MSTPSLETITEMLRTIKEDQLPMMFSEITRRQDIANGKLMKHEDEIGHIKEYNADHKGELRGMKLVGGIAATVLGLIFAFAQIFHH